MESLQRYENSDKLNSSKQQKNPVLGLLAPKPTLSDGLQSDPKKPSENTSTIN